MPLVKLLGGPACTPRPQGLMWMYPPQWVGCTMATHTSASNRDCRPCNASIHSSFRINSNTNTSGRSHISSSTTKLSGSSQVLRLHVPIFQLFDLLG